MRLSKLLPFFAAVLVSAFAWPDLQMYPLETVAILNFGEADSIITVVAFGAPSSFSVSSSSLYTVGTETVVPVEDGFYNYTIPLSHDGMVGKDDITISIGLECVTGTVIVAGMVIKENDNIVSGDNGVGVVAGIEGSTTYDVMAVGTDGTAVDVSSTSFVGMAMSGTYMKQLDVVASSITSTTFTLALVKHRVSTEGFKISFDVPAISYMGKTHETVLRVTHSQTTAPCAAIAGTYPAVDGKVAIDMYNVASDADVTISGAADLSSSSLTVPDQSIVFS